MTPRALSLFAQGFKANANTSSIDQVARGPCACGRQAAPARQLSQVSCRPHPHTRTCSSYLRRSSSSLLAAASVVSSHTRMLSTPTRALRARTTTSRLGVASTQKNTAVQAGPFQTAGMAHGSNHTAACQAKSHHQQPTQTGAVCDLKTLFVPSNATNTQHSVAATAHSRPPVSSSDLKSANSLSLMLLSRDSNLSSCACFVLMEAARAVAAGESVAAAVTSSRTFTSRCRVQHNMQQQQVGRHQSGVQPGVPSAQAAFVTSGVMGATLVCQELQPNRSRQRRRQTGVSCCAQADTPARPVADPPLHPRCAPSWLSPLLP